MQVCNKIQSKLIPKQTSVCVSTYGFVDGLGVVLVENEHLWLLDGVEVGAVDRDHSAARSEALERFDVHDCRVERVVEAVALEGAIGAVDGQRQPRHLLRAGGFRGDARDAAARRLRHVHLARRLVQICGHCGADVEEVAGDGQLSAAARRTHGRVQTFQNYVLKGTSKKDIWSKFVPKI